MKASASSPRSPSRVHTKGVKCLLWARQSCRCLRFLPFSAVLRTPSLVRLALYLLSALTIWTSTMQSVPDSQKPRMLMSPRLPLGRTGPVGLRCGLGVGSGVDWFVVLVVLVVVGLPEVEVLVLRCKKGFIRGSSRTQEGFRALAHISASSYLISSCAPMISPPNLQLNKCSTVPSLPQPSHLLGRDSGRMP